MHPLYLYFAYILYLYSTHTYILYTHIHTLYYTLYILYTYTYTLLIYTIYRHHRLCDRVHLPRPTRHERRAGLYKEGDGYYHTLLPQNYDLQIYAIFCDWCGCVFMFICFD